MISRRETTIIVAKSACSQIIITVAAIESEKENAGAAIVREFFAFLGLISLYYAKERAQIKMNSRARHMYTHNAH
jgi:hypothetical protein